MITDPLFFSVKLNAVGVAKAQNIRELFTLLLADLENTCPVSRELAIVRTKLEEASFYAVKSLGKEKENKL